MSKMKISMVIEILGKPADHVKSSLTELVEKLGSEKGVYLITKTVHEPVTIEGSPNLFTSFAEVEAELNSLNNYFGIIFAYMPSHIEIISPEKLTFENVHLSEIGNILVQRLHSYDAVTKNVLTNSNLILEKIKEISPDVYDQISKFVLDLVSKNGSLQN